MKPKSIISVDQINEILQRLKILGYQLIGPTIENKTIVYDQITAIADLPIGWTDEHKQGSYRLKKRSDLALFGYNLGPATWKKFLFPPQQELFSADRACADFKVRVTKHAETKLALIGVRPCELAAIKIQDAVFSSADHCDLGYTQKRTNAFVLAVNCSTTSAACFCTTMKSGPTATTDYDLAITEIITNKSHYFLLEIGSERGEAVVQDLPSKTAGKKELAAVAELYEKITQQIKIRFDNTKVKKLLQSNLESPLWDELEKRCLSCANCTMVCPTCFCSAIEDTTNLSGTAASRSRKWDSCFNNDFTYMHGGPIRKSIKAKYRHWLTHKLANWHDQFGSSGCVGCGRCISWCPVGIDITEEVVKLQELGE